MRRTHRLALFLAFCGFGLVAAPARADDQAPPLCTDAGWVKKIKTQYEAVEEIVGENLKLKEIREVKELQFGPAPKSFNQYSSTNHFIANVRWCSGIAVIASGQTDPVYWHLADEKNGERHSIQYDQCSAKHDLYKDQCVSYREKMN
jgi:hypothetical protein